MVLEGFRGWGKGFGWAICKGGGGNWFNLLFYLYAKLVSHLRPKYDIFQMSWIWGPFEFVNVKKVS